MNTMPLLVLALIVLVVSGLVASGQDPQRPPRDPVRRPNASAPSTSISGRVTDEVSGRPLASAAVVAVSVARALAGGEMRQVGAITDHQGRYTITGLPAGDYLVHATPGPFRGTHREAARGGYAGGSVFNASPIGIAAGEARTGVDIALPRAYGIEGVVLSEQGRPLVDVSVRASRIDARGFPGLPAVSDDRGMFRVFGLGPGVYRLCAEPYTVSPAPEFVGSDGRRFIRTCTPTIADPAAPGAFRIDSADVHGVVLHLARSGLVTVTGHVLDAAGALAPDASVQMFREEGPGVSIAVPVETVDGSFTARGLVPGDYRVRAQRPAGPDRALQLSTADLRVDGADVAGVVLTLAPGAELRGLVELDGGDLSPEIRGRLRVSGRPPFGRTQLSGEVAVAPVATDLSFVLRSLHGGNVISVQNLPDGWALKSVALLGRDITDRETTFSTRPEADALRVALTNRTARLTVRTFDAAGQPAPRVTALMPADPDRRPGGIRVMGRYVAFGVHDFGSVLPGEYLVVSSPIDGQFDVSGSRTDLERLTATATRISLRIGETRVVDIRSPSGGAP